MEAAHMVGSEISSLSFTLDSCRLLSRSTDDSLKLWDLRSLTKPIAVACDLPTVYAESNAVFSPTESVIITGTSVKKGEGAGYLVFLDSESLKVIKEVPVGNASVARVLWHPKINQIVVGGGDGVVHVFYDDKVSSRGAKLCAARGLRKGVMSGIVFDANIEAAVINPHALPMFRDDTQRRTKRKYEKIRKDAVATRRPGEYFGT
jgi:WD repeat-containing protein 70